jgi:parallel beta-helix repeat protein
MKETRAEGYTDVTVLQAKDMIDSNPSLIVLDVRNESEYLAGHIRNAKLIPVWELSTRLSELNMSDQILVYCKAGGRSAAASQILSTSGFLYVFNMLGGITDWAREQYPVYVKYASIQEAINNATDGNAIYVSTGVYTEHLSVNRSLTLVGEDKHTTIIDGTANGTIFYVNADNISISDFTIRYSGCACAGYCGVNIEINHQNINLTNNIIVSDGYGIQLVKARKVIIAQNNITHTTDSCIVVSDSSEISVLENNITNNFDGIEIDNSTQSIFSDNTIYSSVNGISILDSNNNTFCANNVSSNAIYGFYISQSNNNSILHNTFSVNGRQISTHNSANFWDNGFEGNFWSNYTGVDGNFDGIGDTLHVIDSDNIDNYPLMGKFRRFNTSLDYDVDIVSNSTIDEFEYLEANSTIKLQVSSTATSQMYGFCRIGIPHSLIDPGDGSILVVIDNGQTPVLFLNNSVYDNGTHRWIYFAYQHSTHEILIVPEHSVFLIIPLLMIAIVMITVARKRRRARKC